MKMNKRLAKWCVHRIATYLFILSSIHFSLTSCASFYGSSFISLPIEDSKSTTVISFRLKTYQTDAVLFLAVGPIDYCLIALERAHISVRINLGSGEASLLSKDLKLNDLAWHRVDVQRTDAELSLVIDELHTYFLDIPGKFFELNIKFGVFLGGLGTFNQIYLGELHDYRGCLEDVFYNGIDVIESASKGDGIHHISFECSNQFDASPTDAISFVESGSHIVVPGFANTVRNGGSLSFDIKTSSLISVIFYNEGSGGHQSDFISVELIDGKILLSVNNGDGVVVLQSDIVVTDGYWHSVAIQFSSTYLEISIDKFPPRSLRPSLGDNKYFDLNDQLFVGGIETNKQSIAFKHGLQSILSEGPDSSLRGCLKNIKTNQKSISLRDAKITKGIKSGACVWEFKCLAHQTSPCVDGALCFQEGFSDFKCLCDDPLCVRTNSSSPTNRQFDAKQDNEEVKDSQTLQLQPLRVAEGSTALITHNLINVITDYQKYGITDSEVIFRIQKPPQHGVLEVEVWDRTGSPHFTNSISSSENVFTLNDLITEKVRYTNDGSEMRNDSIGLLLEFNTQFFHLPAHIHSKNFTFAIEIHPINDAPIISHNNSALKISKNSKQVITKEILRAEDDDNSPEEIKYKINAIINGDQSFIENMKNVDIPIESFTQNDINNGFIRFVHKTRFSDTKNQIKVLFTITDRNGETVETTLTVDVLDIELILINNSGISLPYNSFALISATNLSYKTNSDSDLSQYIKFEIIKESQFGCIQKLRANGFWANVSSFSQRQINRNKIRYFHYKDKPNEDVLELQVSYSEIKAPIIRFQIKFKKSKLQVIALNQLTITQDMTSAIISGKDLKFDTKPYSTDPNLIVYTILSKPSFGSLNLITGNTTEELRIGSLVTQQMINDLKLIYNSSENENHINHDSFDFEVATEDGLTNVEVMSFHFKYIRTKTDDFVLTNSKLVVLEGDRATISDKLLKVETINKIGSIHYNITNKPKYGTIKLMNPELNDVIQVSPNIFTEEEVKQNRIVYYHDDSEHNRDLFDFEVFDSQNNFICFGTFTIEVVMKNDNPPVRVIDKVFEVVTDGQKRLSADDIKYVDADIDSSPKDIKYSKTYIPNGNLYFVDRPNEMVEHFTQEDIDNEKVLFKHSGDEFGRSILWISDGQYYASGVLEIKASKPYLKVSKNSGLIVKYGESGLISRHNITVDTNLDITRKSDITIKITSEPKFGQILVGGKESNRFTLQDLIDESIEYESKSFEDDLHVIHDSFTFRLFFNGEDYLSDRVTAENQLFNISIYPHSYFQLNIVNLKNVSVEEDQYVVIDSSSLLVRHQTLSSENIVYMISQLPRMGVLSLSAQNTTPTPMHFPSKASEKSENLLIFTQRDIDDNLIHYKYIGGENTSETDYFKFDVSNGITTVRDLTFYINIISKLITLYTGNITVIEGQSVVLLPEDFVVSNSFYANQIDEYLIIEEPKFGSIVCKDLNDDLKRTKSFTPKLLKEGLISYAHDGSESTRDWLTIVVRANSINKESLPSTIHVMIEPINDERPYVVNNTGLELWEGTSALITKAHLAAVDDDSNTEDIVYQISAPSNGYVTTIDNKMTSIDRFSQIMIDSEIILFVQSGELSGGFRFQVTDGILSSAPHVFVVTAKPVIMSMTVNKKLFVFPRMQQSVTRDHLLVETNDGNKTREFTYHIMKDPKFGRFLLENSDGTTKYCMSFTQKQIDENLVLYEQSKPINDILVEDQIVFDIESHFVQSLKGVVFTVEIAIGNSGQDLTEMTELIEVSPLSVTEGQFGVISDKNLNITQLINYWKNKDFNTKIVDKLYLRSQRSPDHGIILFEGQDITTRLKDIPLNALNKQQLVYKHDNSNSFNDSFVLGIYISNGIDILLSNHTIEVKIIPVNDELPTLLTRNPRINVIFDSKTLISNSLLRTSDRDGLPNNIIYELNVEPSITQSLGFFIVEPNEKPVNRFTQLQVDNKLVYFRHKGLTSEEKKIKFRVKDEHWICSEKHCTEWHSMTLITRQSTLQLFNHSTVQLLQGSITAKIEAKHLSVLSNDLTPENILFLIREGPINGYIIVNDKTNNEKFKQNDINSLKVSYIQINKTSSDYFVVDVMRVQSGQMVKAIENITISIAVKPLVRAKKPFLIASPGLWSVITSDHLDASDLSLITNSVPKFKITSNPKFGFLRRLSPQKSIKRVKRKTTPEHKLTQFTNDDVLSGQIAYLADKELDLSYPNEIITDFIHYELSAHNVQTASGLLVINIVDKKLWIKSQNRDIGTNFSDFEDQKIEIFSESNEINYLNIIITRDHLLIAFVFIVVVILTVALIVIIRFCHSSPTIQTIHKDNKSGPITSTISTSPAILDTPPVSEYAAEMLMMSHRLSPRSTPSVSEMESGMMPMAPPTSPSMSTNCSILETRSHTATPRSLLRLPMSGRLRGGCSGVDDFSMESSPCNIFPLPPPSLYFENESNMSPTTDWSQSSIPLCKVPPIVPQCLKNHYHCAQYQHNQPFCPFNQDPSNDMSVRILGDGTSLVGSPAPSLRKTPWSSDDLPSPTLSNEGHPESSPQFKGFMTYNESKSPNSDIYITDGFSTDSLNLQHELGQTVPKQKQQYWV